MRKFNYLRLSIVVNILALAFFISPFYPIGCKSNMKQAVPEPTSEEILEPDSISSTIPADSICPIYEVSADSIGKADSLSRISRLDSFKQTQDENKFTTRLEVFLWGNGDYCTGLFCIVADIDSYVTKYGIITAFFLLLISLLLKNKYDKWKFIIIAILELISIPLLFFTNFDLGLIKAVPDEKLWGFWVCSTLIIILFLIDIFQILITERRNKKNGS